LLWSETKRSEIQVYFFSLFFTFFAFCRFFRFFALNFSLLFDLVTFASKRNKAKRNSSLFFRFFRFLNFFSLFFAFFVFFVFFRLIFVSLRFFCLFYLRFRFRFLLFGNEVNHVKSGFSFASKRNEIFASISNFASEAKVRAHLNTDPLMGAKLKSKTHLQNTFFVFLSRFLRVWLQSLKKVVLWLIKKFVEKNLKRCQKTQNFTLISNPLKKLLKNAPNKSYKQNKFDKHE
jgi:hypothetical protein